jgi:leucyl aminopeptidase (aminopeptidase T)
LDTEKVLILTNTDTFFIGETLKSLIPNPDRVCLKTIPNLTIHGEEPGEDVSRVLKQFDVIFGLTKMSLAHTQARIQAASFGARYLSLPDYTEAVVQSHSLHFDFSKLTDVSNALALRLTQGKRLVVTSEKGTHVTFNIQDRTGNAAPGTCWNKGGLASPPDAESNIAPIETFGDGVIVVDGSIPCKELGLLKETITLTLSNGIITDISGGHEADVLRGIYDRYDDPNVRRIAEVGIGLNPYAQLIGSMLEDEGVLGTVHFGFGANRALGGTTMVPFHLDHIVRDVSVQVDDEWIIKNGHLQGSLYDLYPNNEVHTL